MLFSSAILSFISNLRMNVELPSGIEAMNPFLDQDTIEICKLFYNKYYGDNFKRHLILGINPGRFGGGITGIPFTDPIRLQNICGIENTWQKKQELSSLFVYDMIRAYGGPEKFYQEFYISSIVPLGFTRGNKNLNYYDDKQLEESVKEFVIASLKQQLSFGINTDAVFCLGEGKNFAYLSKLNLEYKLFDNVVPLSHPRFIMQYKLKKKDEYIEKYLEALSFTRVHNHEIKPRNKN